MSGKHRLILVVDDDLFTAELTGMIVEMVGYEAIIAEGGMDALQKIDEHEGICAVISDMNMPLMNGVELFEQMRYGGFNLPFILLTGDDAAPISSACPEIDAVMTKNESLQEELPDMILSLLQSVKG